jgi:hypothetical protein
MLPKPSANSVTPVPKIVHIRLIKTFVEAISHSLLVGKWLEKEAMEGHAVKHPFSFRSDRADLMSD